MYNSQLATFIKVADAGSFSKAAQLLFISPNAVKKQIDLLENHLGFRLFDRTHHGVNLNDSGKSLYQDAQYIIQYSYDSLVRAKSAINKNETTIRIGTSLITPPQFLLELWPKIQMSCPNIKFQLVPFENTPENAREIMANFGQNIDLVAGIYDTALLKDRKCAAIELYKTSIYCALSIHHPLANKEKLFFDDLKGQRLLLLKPGYMEHIDDLRNEIYKKLKDIEIVNFPFYDINIFNKCANSEDLLMVVESWKNVHPLLKIVPVEWEYEIPFGIMYSLNPSNEVTQFIKTVKEICINNHNYIKH